MRVLELLLRKQLVGLDIGVSGIKAVEISREKIPKLLAYNRIPLPWDTISLEGEVRNRDTLVLALKKLFESGNFSTKNVAVAAFGRSIITKRISVPMMSEEELDHQLYWEAEQYIPFNINEVNLDFAILGPNSQTLAQEPKMDVLLVAAKKDFIQFLQSLVKEAGLNPVIVDSQGFALANTFEFNYQSAMQEQGGTTNVLIDFGAAATKITIMEGVKTTFSRDIQFAGTRASELLIERLGISIEEAEKLKILNPNREDVEPLLLEYGRSIVDEISRSLDFFLSQSMDNSIDAIYACGGGLQLHGLLGSLNEKMPAPLIPLNPFKHIIGTGKKINPALIEDAALLGAVATGLSLRRQGDV